MSCFSLTNTERPLPAHFNLGVLDNNKIPSENFGLSFDLPTTDLELHSERVSHLKEPKAAEHLDELAVDIAIELAHGHFVKSAYDAAKSLHEALEPNDHSAFENTVCKTAKFAAEFAGEAAIIAPIIGGVPLMLAEAPIAIPVAAALLPQAYANGKAVVEYMGEAAEEECHLRFTEYRQNH